MSISKHHGKWRFDFWSRGIRHRKGGFKTKVAAQMAEVEARKNLAKIDTDFISLCESRLRELEAKRTGKYLHENRKLIEKLVLGNITTRQKIEDYLYSIDSPWVANKELRFIKALWNHGMKRGLADHNPAVGIDFFPIKKKQKYVPPVEDINKVLWECNFEQYCYLMIVINTVGRISEVNNLKKSDVHEDYLILRSRKAKNSDLTERIIPLNEQLLFVLDQLETSEYVLENPRTGKKYDYRKLMLKGLCKRAGVKYFTFHSLRHFGTSLMAKHGIPITDIQKVLGHTQISTTNIYLHSIGQGIKKATGVLWG